MTKNKKLWLYAGLALFAIPEILWSPIINFLWPLIKYSNHSIPVRNNWLMSPDNINWLSVFLFVQFFGALACSIILLSEKYISHKLAGLLSAIIALVIIILFGLSITLRSIGF